MYMDGNMMRNPQRGVSIVEIMIALAISLVILLAIARTYVASSSTQQAQADATRLNESARYATDLITKELRKAGFRNTWTPNSNPLNTVCTAPSVGAGVRLIEGLNDATDLNPIQTNVLGGTGTPIMNRSDVLRIRYYGDLLPAVGGSSSVLDCQGYPVTASNMTVDTLYVAADGGNNGEPTLYCFTTNIGNPNSATSTPLPMVSGVESLQLLYGEDTDADGVINHYVPWNLLTNVSNPDNVSSVKISVVVRSTRDVALTTNNETFRHFSSAAITYPHYSTASGGTNIDPGAEFAGPTDRRLRQIFSTEVAIRNHRYCE
jgi:type IV pilus assembly protein PilW